MARLSARRPAAQQAPPARIGVLVQWGIGDTVLATPLLAGLRVAWPAARIDALGKPWLAELFAGEAFVDRCVGLVPPWTRLRGKYRVWDRDWRVFAGQIAAARATRYDLLVSVRWDARELLQSRLLNAAVVAGFAAAGGRGWVTTDLGLDATAYNAMHRSEAAAYAARVLTGHAVGAQPRLTPSDDERRQALDQMRRVGHAGGPVLALHAGAGSPVRRWPAARFGAALRAVRDRIGCLVMIDDAATGSVEPPPGVPCLRWSGSLAGLKSLLSLCDLLLCNDSGPMHVAAAVGCRTVAIFGPTSSLWFCPSGPGHRVVVEEPMPCRPCFDRCIYASALCLDRIAVDDVVAALRAALDETPAAAASPMAAGHAR